jgi:glucosamine-6-phosphate deaminase
LSHLQQTYGVEIASQDNERWWKSLKKEKTLDSPWSRAYVNDMTNFNSFLTLSAEELAATALCPFEILSTAVDLFWHMAHSIAAEIKANNLFGQPTRLILPVGPTGQYPLLAQICNQERISWKNVHTFNMDEYCDWQGRSIPIDHPLSFRGFMLRMLFSQLDPELRIPAEQIHFPDPLQLDTISHEIQQVGGIDTCYGGIGYHGHVAFNEPPLSRYYRISAEEFRRSLTRVVQLAPETVVMNSIRNSGGNSVEFPAMGVTLGMADILASRRIRLYCPGGAWQRTVLRITLMGDEDVAYPSTLLLGHPDIAIFADRQTAEPPGMAL